MFSSNCSKVIIFVLSCCDASASVVNLRNIGRFLSNYFSMGLTTMDDNSGFSLNSTAEYKTSNLSKSSETAPNIKPLYVAAPKFVYRNSQPNSNEFQQAKLSTSGYSIQDGDCSILSLLTSYDSNKLEQKPYVHIYIFDI